MSMERVAVTGGNGRIGNAVISELNNHGYYTINIDIEPKYRTETRRSNVDEEADEYRTTDLTDAGETYGSLARSDADAVFHAGTILRPTSHPGFVTYESNAMTTYHVLEAANELELENVCLASSINVVGSNYQEEPTEVEYLPMDEDHPLTPRDPYALGKHTLEINADGFARLDEPPYSLASIRFPWVLYDDELTEMFVETDRSLEGIKNPPEFMADVNEYTTRDVLFSYLHIDDAASIVHAALEADYEGHERFWAVAADTTVSSRTADVVAEYYPDVDVRADFEGRKNLISIEKARNLLDWEPEHSWIDL